MNLFEIQERLKDFSKDQLVKEMQMPSTPPGFLKAGFRTWLGLWPLRRI